MNTRYVRAEFQSLSSNRNSTALKLTQPAGEQRAIHIINPAPSQDRIAQVQPFVRAVPIKSGVLNSWKEIATYLGRGVRTVQRWEAELNLPIHRPRGKTRSAVVAFRQELDDWLERTPSQSDEKEISNGLLDIAQDMQALAQQMFASATLQQHPEREQLIEAANKIVQRLNLLMNTNPGSSLFDRTVLSETLPAEQSDN
jgi:hypothetical protein